MRGWTPVAGFLPSSHYEEYTTGRIRTTDSDPYVTGHPPSPLTKTICNLWDYLSEGEQRAIDRAEHSLGSDTEGGRGSMDYQAFYYRLVAALPVGAVLQNPGGGTTEIVAHTGTGKLVYQRGRSRFYVPILDLYAAYRRFQEQTVSSTDLRGFAPEVFDSRYGGHSCNCTLLFLALRAMGLVDTIEGAGKRGDPYRVDLGGHVSG